jgi:prevent-host-death family protein
MATGGKRGTRRAGPGPSSAAGARRVIEVKAGVFKDQCLQLLDQVRDQAVELIVTKHGAPVARVVPLETQARGGFGFLRGTVLHEDDIVSPDFDAWGESD